ncbi:MAG TPA: competence/damage-inducible protein A [Candidatus Ozemobacteraceae bacterium]|nr:competence/damage-inducible protein A [Candidatus Ozemobacteraceae bacterium]
MGNRTAEIVSIGTELLLGELVDTNAVWIAGELRRLGYFIYYKTTVGDNRARLGETIGRAFKRADLVVTSGGLGPTDDDLTREAIADVCGAVPREDPGLVSQLEAMFAARGRPMPAVNRKQAWLIPGARPLENPIGTAPGWWVEKDGRTIVAMPGPPHEMKRMWNEQVMPALPRGAALLWDTTLHTIGIGEGDVAQILAEFTNTANPSVATYARRHGVDVRVAAGAGEIEAAKALAAPVLATVERRLAKFIYGRDSETLSQSIGKRLASLGQSLAVIESVTGGLVADMLTDTPGASDWLKAGVVAYTRQAKEACGVSPDLLDAHGCVAEETSRAMADAVRQRYGTDWSVATTGVAGPAAMDGKPVGLAFVAVSGPGITRTMRLEWPGERRQVKERTASGALGLLLRLLRGDFEP